MSTDCQHHWVIETPNGPTSRGRCKRCKETRKFSNGGDYYKDGTNGWDNTLVIESYAASGRMGENRTR